MNTIGAFTIIDLIFMIEQSFGQGTVAWDVNKTDEFKNGETMELICTVTGTTCCTALRRWNGGPNFDALMNNGLSSDSTKYKEIINLNSFSLLIYNMDRSDFLNDYRCTYGFAVSSTGLLSPPLNARYVPAASEIQELSSSTVGGLLSFEVNVTSVFPEPICTATFGSSNLTSNMTLTSAENFPFKFAVLSMTNVAYSCPGSLSVSCRVGSYLFDVLTVEPCSSCTDGDMCIVVVLVIVGCVDCVIVIFLVTKPVKSFIISNKCKIMLTLFGIVAIFGLTSCLIVDKLRSKEVSGFCCEAITIVIVGILSVLSTVVYLTFHFWYFLHLKFEDCSNFLRLCKIRFCKKSVAHDDDIVQGSQVRSYQSNISAHNGTPRSIASASGVTFPQNMNGKDDGVENVENMDKRSNSSNDAYDKLLKNMLIKENRKKNLQPISGVNPHINGSQETAELQKLGISRESIRTRNQMSLSTKDPLPDIIHNKQHK